MAVETNHFIAFYTSSSNTQLTEINNGTKKTIHIFIDLRCEPWPYYFCENFLINPPPPSNKKSIPTETELLFVGFFFVKTSD